MDTKHERMSKILAGAGFEFSDARVYGSTFLVYTSSKAEAAAIGKFLRKAMGKVNVFKSEERECWAVGGVA